MTWLDRLLVAFARFAIGLLHRRFSTAHQRVWWTNIDSYRPTSATFPDVPETWPPEMTAGQVRVAFGQPGHHGHSSPPAPLFTMIMTRRMLDMLIDGAVEMRNTQDIQLRALRRPNPFGLRETP